MPTPHPTASPVPSPRPRIAAAPPLPVLLLVTLLAPHLAAAQAGAQRPSPELITDRPDQTESAVTVPPGTIQLETGVDHVDNGGDPRSESTAFGSSLLRIGLAEGLELRLGWGGWAREEEGGAAVEGAADADVGLKVGLWEERGGRPQAALLAGISAPVGARGLSGERWDPALRLAFAHDLAPGVGLGYNVGMVWSSEEPAGVSGRREAVSRLEYTIAVGFGLTERLGAFVELFGDAPVDSRGGPAHAADAGLTWLLTPRIQLDLAAGAGLSGEAPDLLATAGISVRWPR